jgi:GH15 family glucan-1,4-alpha-glucosidase
MPERPDTLLGIEDHGLIGDLRTAALVGTDGTIDWFCAPRFDSPSVFGAILDPDEGGSWQIAPHDGVVRTQQFYFPDSAMLATRFLTESGSCAGSSRCGARRRSGCGSTRGPTTVAPGARRRRWSRASC